MTADIKPYIDDKSVETHRREPRGRRVQLVVPTYVADAGVKAFKDIAKYKDKLDGKIYGIEAGNDGNRIILDMIEKPKNGLGRLRAGRKLRSRAC